MRANQTSFTAQNNAAIRVFESLRPPAERVCHDPYAGHFLSDDLRQAPALTAALIDRLTAWEKRFPGVCDAIVVRTRFIDDSLQAAIKEGLQQLVILGAGFDTRALRFEDLIKGITVYELDHPATQAAKLERMRRHMRVIPEHVVFVPIDFNENDPGSALSERGYDRAAKSFFIWEGMTYYLSSSVVKKTLAFISQCASEGTQLVFDYFPRNVVDGTTPLREAKALRAALSHIGEEFLFGLEPATVNAFLNAHGFDLVKHLTAADCNRCYFRGPNRGRAMSEMFFLALAKVKRKVP